MPLAVDSERVMNGFNPIKDLTHLAVRNSIRMSTNELLEMLTQEKIGRYRRQEEQGFHLESVIEIYVHTSLRVFSLTKSPLMSC